MIYEGYDERVRQTNAAKVKTRDGILNPEYLSHEQVLKPTRVAKDSAVYKRYQYGFLKKRRREYATKNFRHFFQGKATVFPENFSEVFLKGNYYDYLMDFKDDSDAEDGFEKL